MSKTSGHPTCLRIALVFFVLTFGLCICAVSAQETARDARGTRTTPVAERASVPNAADSGQLVYGRGSVDGDTLAMRDATGIATRIANPIAGSEPARAHLFALVTAGYLALSGADFYLSNRCIQSGQCVEIGSYRGVANHPLAFALVKMTASSALAATAWSLRKHHPKAAWGTLIGLTVAQAGVVYWNCQQGMRR